MKKIIYIILFLIIIALWAYLYQLINYIHISAKFKELRPFKHNIPVYYKGIVIGKAHERRHSKDYQHTIVKIDLFSKKLLLPMNSEILLKKEKKKKKEYDFIEIVYPKEPSNIMIADGAILEGKTTVDMEQFFYNQHPNDILLLRNNLLESSENLNTMLIALSSMFVTLNDILSENQQDISNAAKNLSHTTKNLNNATRKIDNAIDEKAINKTFNNVENLSSNFTYTSQNINNSIPNTLDNLREISSNINAITCAIRKTLRKPFSTLRLLFGKVNTECEN